MNKKQWKPGEQCIQNLDLNVVDASGNVVGEISVSAGNRIPPTRIENAVGYVEK